MMDGRIKPGDTEHKLYTECGNQKSLVSCAYFEKSKYKYNDRGVPCCIYLSPELNRCDYVKK